ncbi:MAG: polysaccharide deacetylase family protein [Pseudomonadota bacterium]
MRPDSLILLFHAIGTPAETGYKDAVSAEAFAQALRWLGDHYQVCPLDQLLQRLQAGHSISGQAALTFDDNHRSLAEVALPLAAAQGLPATWFIMTGPLAGRPFWRRRLTALQASGQEAAFRAFLYVEAPAVAARLRPGKLYKDSKDPDRVSPAEMARLLAAFLPGQAPAEDQITAGELASLRLPGLTLGNHSRDHLVMAGLSAEAQAQEVARASESLAAYPQPKSRLFAVPFGGAKTYNAATAAAVTAAGLSGLAVTVDGLAAADDLTAHPELEPGQGLARSLARALFSQSSMRME